MASRIDVEKTWRQIAAEVAQEDDPVKPAQLTRELSRAFASSCAISARHAASAAPLINRESSFLAVRVASSSERCWLHQRICGDPSRCMTQW